MIVVSVISKALGFVRSAVVAALFGVNINTDSFYLGLSMLGVFSGPFEALGVTSVAIIPHIREREKTNRYYQTILNLTLVLSAALALILAFNSRIITHLFSINYDDEQLQLVSSIVKIMMPLLILLSCVNILSGVLNANYKHIAVQCIGLPLNLLWIAIPVAFWDTLGIRAVVIGYALGLAVQMIILAFSCRKLFRYRPRIDLKMPQLRETLRLCLPVCISSGAVAVQQAVEKSLASGLAEGSITILNSANQLIILINSIFTMSIITILYTSMAAYAADEDTGGLKRLNENGIASILLVTIPFVVFIALYKTFIVKFIYQRGAFLPSDTQLTSDVFFSYAFSLLPTGIGLCIGKCFYALRDTKTPLIITFVNAAVNIVLGIALLKPLGINAIPVTFSIAAWVSAILYVALITRKIGRMNLQILGLSTLRALVGSALSVVACLALKRFVTHDLLCLVLGILVGGCLYVVTLYILKEPMLRSYRNKNVS